MTKHVIEVTGDGDGACDGGEDCFETTDMAFLTPVGKSGKQLQESNLVIDPGSGKGLYAGQFGRMWGSGFIRFPAGDAGSVSWNMHGNVCSQ